MLKEAIQSALENHPLDKQKVQLGKPQIRHAVCPEGGQAISIITDLLTKNKRQRFIAVAVSIGKPHAVIADTTTELPSNAITSTIASACTHAECDTLGCAIRRDREITKDRQKRPLRRK